MAKKTKSAGKPAKTSMPKSMPAGMMMQGMATLMGDAKMKRDMAQMAQMMKNHRQGRSK